MNKYCFQPIRVISEDVLQQCEDDMVHEHNKTMRQQWGWDLCSTGTQKMCITIIQTGTYTYCVVA